MDFSPVNDTVNSSAAATLGNGSFRNSVAFTGAPELLNTVTPLYGLICLVNTVMNITNLSVILRNKKLHTTTNLFIANLAISDLITNVPIVLTPLYARRNEWLWGLHLCKTFFVISSISVLVSSFTLAAMAVYRYRAICTERKSSCRLRVRQAMLVCAGIWLFAVATCVPLIMNVRLVGRSRYQCIESWPNKMHRNVFTWCLMLLQFAAPVTLMGFCNVRIHIFLKNQLYLASATIRKAREGRRIQTLRRRERIHRILLAMVVAYTLCWLPLNIFNILIETIVDLKSWAYIMHVYFSVHIVAMLSTVLNPLLYAVLNRQIRTYILAALKIAVHDRMSETPTMY